MDKINLHDSLRMYLPGLLLSGLFYLAMTGTLNDISSVAVSALFVGLLLDVFFEKFHKNYFALLTKKKLFGYKTNQVDFLDAWKAIVCIQLKKGARSYAEKLDKMNSIDERDELSYICTTFFAKSFSSETLLYFRLPKSFGILCYNSFMVCMVGVLIFSFHCAFGFVSPYKIKIHPFFMCYFLAIVGGIFFAGSRAFFLQSLNRELLFWSALSTSDLEAVKHLIDLSENLKETKV